MHTAPNRFISILRWTLLTAIFSVLSSDSLIAAAPMKAPEFEGAKGWLNTDHPIRLAELRGKVVLLDFWTYCCINCMHIIPDLKKLEARYPNELVVIGIHSAKFKNEQETDNIRQAILRYEIEHPVANDADFVIWGQFEVEAWPTLVLINVDGTIVGAISGEGHYKTLEKAVGNLVERARQGGTLNAKPLRFAPEKDKTASRALSFPGKIVADEKNDRLFISDSNHNRIVVTDLDGKLVAMMGSGKVGRDNGSYLEASFNHPQGMAWKEPWLYVADTENHLIRRIDVVAKKVETLAGTGRQAPGRSGGGPALTTDLSSPWDLALVGGRLYIAMAGSHQIWALDLKSQRVGPVAGSGREDIADGTALNSAYAQPSGLATDGKTLWVADSETSSIRAFDIKGGSTTTVLGKGLFMFGDVDGSKEVARLQHPLGVAWHEGKLYVADSYNHKIKRVDPIRRLSQTFLGNGQSKDLYEPGGLAFANGKLFVADTNHHRILVADLSSPVLRPLAIDAPLPNSPQARNPLICEGNVCRPQTEKSKEESFK